MTNNTLKALLLSAVMTVAGMGSSCTSRNNADEEQKEKMEQEAQKEADIKAKRAAEWDRVYHYTCDSINAASGCDAIKAELKSLPDKCHDENSLEEFEKSRTLGRHMDIDIMKSGSEILKRAETEVANALKKYDLPYNSNLTGVFNRDVALRSMVFCLPEESADYSYNPMWAFDGWQKNINEEIDESDYGDARKQEIKQAVDNVITKTKSDLRKNREAIVKKYSPYISEYQYSEPGLNETFEFIIPSKNYTEKIKDIWVYDQNLSKSFFGDKDAVYKLVSVGTNEWQVVKNNKNGKIEKTEIFTDKGTHYIDVQEKDEKPLDKVGDSWFEFSPGTNIGVRVHYREVTEVRSNKNVWTPSPFTEAEQHTMDSLRQEISRKENLKHMVDSLCNVADSIATNRANSAIEHIK